MAKKIMGYIKLQLAAGSATMQPPVGPAFGQRGLAGINFVKEFNARTAQMEKGIPIPVVVTYYQDKSFSFEMKNPPVSHYLKRAAGLTSASKTPGRGGFVGKVTKKQVREIAETKIKDLNCDTVDSAMSMIEGSARSMGLQVVE